MPTYRGEVSEEQVLDLITYIKTLETPEEAAAREPEGDASVEVARAQAGSEPASHEGEIR